MKERTYDITALGEALIDFTYCGISGNGMRLFEQNPGGAPMNMLSAAVKAGLKTAFIGKVGADMHGMFLKETAERAGIYTGGMIVSEDVFTTLAFVILSENGERSFSFARKPGADTMLKYEEVDKNILLGTRVFHFGSLSLTDVPARTATVKSVEFARGTGAVISYDPNYREALWSSRDAAVEGMRSVLPLVDIMKLSDEETKLLTPYEDPEKAADDLLGKGIKLIAVTLGSKGALVCTRDGKRIVPGFKSKTADTTGAGDTFWGGFVSQFVKSGLAPEDVTCDMAAGFAAYGNAAASLCVEKRGGITSIPEEAETLKRLKSIS